jgi:toxin ParE1/3/4
MYTARKLPQAQDDLLDIWLHIAQDSLARADHFLDMLEEKIHLLASSPRIGRMYPELGDNLRAFPVRDYLVIYREATSSVEVVRVLHGARDIENALRPNSDEPAT